jgi:hypothetical protein
MDRGGRSSSVPPCWRAHRQKRTEEEWATSSELKPQPGSWPGPSAVARRPPEEFREPEPGEFALSLLATSFSLLHADSGAPADSRHARPHRPYLRDAADGQTICSPRQVYCIGRSCCAGRSVPTTPSGEVEGRRSVTASSTSSAPPTPADRRAAGVGVRGPSWRVDVRRVCLRC